MKSNILQVCLKINKSQDQQIGACFWNVRRRVQFGLPVLCYVRVTSQNKCFKTEIEVFLIWLCLVLCRLLAKLIVIVNIRICESNLFKKDFSDE